MKRIDELIAKGEIEITNLVGGCILISHKHGIKFTNEEMLYKKKLISTII